MLTNNTGHALGNDKAEKIVDDADPDADSLTFPDYFAIISSQLFKPSNSDEPVLVPSVVAEIDKICWMLCEADYHKNSTLKQSGASLNSDDLFRLWKLFNFMAKVDLDGTEDRLNTAVLPLRVDIEEAHRMGSLIRQAVGCSALDIPTVDPREEDQGDEDFVVDFIQFVVIVCKAAQGLAEDVLSQGIKSVYIEVLNDVIKKVCLVCVHVCVHLLPGVCSSLLCYMFWLSSGSVLFNSMFCSKKLCSNNNDKRVSVKERDFLKLVKMQKKQIYAKYLRDFSFY